MQRNSRRMHQDGDDVFPRDQMLANVVFVHRPAVWMKESRPSPKIVSVNPELVLGIGEYVQICAAHSRWADLENTPEKTRGIDQTFRTQPKAAALPHICRLRHPVVCTTIHIDLHGIVNPLPGILTKGGVAKLGKQPFTTGDENSMAM